MLTREEGDFGAILERSDLIVELIGGTDPARDYVLDALRAKRPVVTANKQLLAQHGEELFDAAREAGVQLRFEAAVAGVIPIVRVIQESFGVTEIAKVFGIVNGTTNFILSEMAAERRPLRGGPRPRPGARLRRGRPDRRRQRRRRGGEDGDPRPPRLPHAGDVRRGLLRGDRADQTGRPRLRQGARPLAEAARRRRTPRGRDQRARLPLLPLPAATRSRRSRARSTRSWSRRRRSPR